MDNSRLSDESIKMIEDILDAIGQDMFLTSIAIEQPRQMVGKMVEEVEKELSVYKKINEIFEIKKKSNEAVGEILENLHDVLEEREQDNE